MAACHSETRDRKDQRRGMPRPLPVPGARPRTLRGEENVGVAARTFHSNWSSPAFGSAAGKDQIIFGAGDGWCYGFDSNKTKTVEGTEVFSELWRFDCDLPQYRMKNGKPQKY